eukprot:CAMPEP_0206327008 /NCGR_PEP_ID=MMETSP0106_2-20121207/21921_1 /ASSEMBLY_ACC=CAM_ASM_000206 /TAXON_ID=81532 /ORGANISM="Acanthoeca-like sp., Strain 10tr" /LENGTH=231 /DNA_ID=CAMNT_0053759601 /DNA_START=416 /DNA_END=1109 /DNA_ORIENTATION=-
MCNGQGPSGHVARFRQSKGQGREIWRLPSRTNGLIVSSSAVPPSSSPSTALGNRGRSVAGSLARHSVSSALAVASASSLRAAVDEITSSSNDSIAGGAMVAGLTYGASARGVPNSVDRGGRSGPLLGVREGVARLGTNASAPREPAEDGESVGLRPTGHPSRAAAAQRALPTQLPDCRAVRAWGGSHAAWGWRGGRSRHRVAPPAPPPRRAAAALRVCCWTNAPVQTPRPA